MTTAGARPLATAHPAAFNAAPIFRTSAAIHAAVRLARTATGIVAAAVGPALRTAVEPRTVTTRPALPAEVLPIRAAFAAAAFKSTAFGTATIKAATLGTPLARTATPARAVGRTVRTTAAATIKVGPAARAVKSPTFGAAPIGPAPLRSEALAAPFRTTLARSVLTKAVLTKAMLARATLTRTTAEPARRIPAIARTGAIARATIIRTTAFGPSIIGTAIGASPLHIQTHLLALGVRSVRRGHATFVTSFVGGLGRSHARQEHHHRHRTQHLPGHTDSLRLANSLASLNAVRAEILPAPRVCHAC